MASALIEGSKEPQWTQDSVGGRMPYQKLGGADCRGCNGQCTGTCGKAPIGGQIDSSGFLAQESNRVNSVGYTTAELQNLFRLAQISRSVQALVGAVHGDNDLFFYTSKTGGSVRGALDFLVPYAIGDKTWTHPTETHTWMIFPELRMAANIFGNLSYSKWAADVAKRAGGCPRNCTTSDALLWWPPI